MTKCSFCGRKFVKIVLEKNGKSICGDCLGVVNELQNKKDYKLRCPSCENPLISFDEELEIDKITFKWSQEEDGSLRLIDITPINIRERIYTCDMCGEEIELDREIISCKDKIFNKDKNTWTEIKKRINLIIEKSKDKDKTLSKILNTLNRFSV